MHITSYYCASVYIYNILTTALHCSPPPEHICGIALKLHIFIYVPFEKEGYKILQLLLPRFYAPGM